MCYSQVISLENGFYVCKRGIFFELVGYGKTIMVLCTKFDYIVGKIIALQRYDTIHIFSLETLDINNEKTMKEIATLDAYGEIDSIKVSIGSKTYNVSKYCKITP